MPSYFVRYGSLAELQPATSPVRMPRGCRVVMRTAAGLQWGEITGPCQQGQATAAARILRPTTAEDELLIRRLTRHKGRAIERCRAVLSAAGSRAVLLEMDPLLDGTSLVMHFLGEVDETAESITAQIVEEYDSVVRTRHFAKLLRDGCGPQCGSGDAGGCGSEACATCAAACATTRSVDLAQRQSRQA